jgi:hypothetical protein
MKKIIYFSIFLTSLFSCTSNDSISTPISQNDLLGSWNISEFYTNNGNASVYFDGQHLSGTFNAFGSNFNMTALFEEIPNNFSTSGDFTLNSTISLLNQQFSNQEIIAFIPQYISPASWLLQDNSISFSSQNETILAEIIYFNNDTLRLKTIINEGILQHLDSLYIQQIDSSAVFQNIDSLKINAEFFLTFTK